MSLTSILHTLGLGPSALGVEPVAHPAAIIISNFVFAYAITSTRAVKNRFKFDHNVSPRQDVTKYGDKMVKDGKISQAQLDRIVRNESSHANTVEHFPFLFGSVLFMVMAKLPPSTINTFGALYTLARVVYHVAYLGITTQTYSWIRTVAWWSSNICCFTAIVKSANALA